MAKSQRSISVSEFFEKNRHLLGFGNDHRALLTTVKEAVDNSLDACEEAGITPEIWVHIEQTGERRYKAGIQDNGPGIVKKQIPLIFGKLLYGSKFHRLRMSRGQQGIGISAAGMYGVLTTGKPVKIISKVSIRKPTHYYEIRINTKTNDPEILNGGGDGVDIPPNDEGRKYIADHGIEWVSQYDAEGDQPPVDVPSGTRVTIELQAVYKRGRGSVDEYLEQTAIANPHVTIHLIGPDGVETIYRRSTVELPSEAKEINPHPYGVELGRLQSMLKDAKPTTLSQWFRSEFSCVTPVVAKKICETAKVGVRSSTSSISRDEAEALYLAIQQTKIKAPSTDCISPIGEQLLLSGLHKVVPGEFYAASTRPPAVYRGNPFQVEVALAYGGAAETQKISRDMLEELLSQSDARTLRKFLITTFSGVGAEAAEKILNSSKMPTRKSPAKLKRAEVERLHEAMHNVSLNDGQSMQVLRFANRVPLQFQPKACAITNAVIGTNWRAYGLSQSRASLPNGPISVVVHLASVWVPFTSESKEAVASYPEIEKELRLGLQMVGRKLGVYLNRRNRVKEQGERRNIFLRYLGEVADAVASINQTDRDALYDNLVEAAKKKTADADLKLDAGDKPPELAELEADSSVLIVDGSDEMADAAPVNGSATGTVKPNGQGRLF
ncbi:DNA topoisomerase VI subunit B [Lignipirellula cremea]|nr:DNA topoisomerase VI subunit B [Lignipirellula cremea]